ncbi:MAG: RHS repeat-associated core domain-containing protein, partial [bacterium]
TYSYGLLTASRIDPSSATAYTFTLDKFGREVGMVDPIHGSGSPWTTAYAADGRPTTLQAPNGNVAAYTYDSAGRLLTMNTTGTGSVSRAAYTYASNAAGQRLSENSQISGDSANGTATFAYDPVGRLATYGGVSGIATQGYTWDKVPNRLTKTIGSTTLTTSFDLANRPASDSNGTYAVDADGRVTSRPLTPTTNETFAYDSLGRLSAATIGGVSTNYTYDPLDRLVTSTRGSTISKLRFVGTTATIAQARDGSNVVQYNLATGLGGDARFDFSGGGVSQRYYGTNAHHDVTWTADASGAVIATERYDPYGLGLLTSGASVPDLRFQSSWFDSNTGLSWATNRWYAPDLGTFTSEDSNLGEPTDPESRQLYAYGAGDPIGRADPSG